MKTTTLVQKIFLIIFGFLVTIVFLEVALRLGGFTFLKIQEIFNQVSLTGGEYKILCLGESTTALGGNEAYPRQLERVLNSRQSKLKISVINKGIPSVTTSHIVTHIEKYLDEYKPQMVVVMMGINDPMNASIDNRGEMKGPTFIFSDFRAYKLIKLLFLHLTHKKEKVKFNQLDKQIEKMKLAMEHSPSVQGLRTLAAFYRVANHPDEERDVLLKILKFDSNDLSALFYLGMYYKKLGDYEKAVENLQKIVSLKPKDREFLIETYANLAESLKLQRNYPEAEKVYLESIRFMPNHPGAYGCLAESYLEQGKSEEAQKFFEKQLAINPRAVLFYGKLAHLYRLKGRFADLESLLKMGIEQNPDADILYIELGNHFLENKKFSEAEAVLLKALALPKDNPQEPDVDTYKYLLKSYEGQSKFEEARRIKYVLDAHENNISPLTKRNYIKLKNILEKRNITLVAVSYPLRSIEPLKEILGPKDDMLFVDSQNIFTEALSKGNYDEYFTDRFAGDFGHCTPKGNNLLANNIAETIEAYLKLD